MERVMRPCRPEQAKSWAEFLDQNFGYEAPHSYAVDFAPLFKVPALARSRLVWDGDTIVSSATIYPVTAVTINGPFHLGIVGAVATNENYRGKGISSLVLGDLEDTARAQRMDAIVLWSDQAEFYTKCGYVLAGRQALYPLESLPPPDRIPSGTPVYGWDWRQVRSLYEQHPLRVARSDDYWISLQDVKSVTRVQWVGDDGTVLAYLGFDRGRDLHGIVHEWGGERRALHALLWTVLQNRPGLVWLTHPKLIDPIRAMLPENTAVHGTLAYFKPLAAGLSAKDFDNVWFWGMDSL